MKRLLIFIPFVFMSCEEENIEPTPTTCDCFKYEQQLIGGGSWQTISTTPTSIELCEKDGDTVYTSIMTRYIWECQ